MNWTGGAGSDAGMTAGAANLRPYLKLNEDVNSQQ
jgi:hypothetical protein